MCAVLPFNQWSSEFLNRLWMLEDRMEELCLIISQVLELPVNFSFDVKFGPKCCQARRDKVAENLHSMISMSRISSWHPSMSSRKEFKKESSKKGVPEKNVTTSFEIQYGVKFLLICFNIWCIELMHKDLSVLIWIYWLFVATVIGNWIC